MIKFVGFYLTAEAVYDHLETSYDMKKADMSDASQLAVTFASGYWAGIFCAVATQPMDNLVSMKGNPDVRGLHSSSCFLSHVVFFARFASQLFTFRFSQNKSKGWGQMASEMGTRDLFLKGLGTRVLMIGTLTGLQWWIYGSFKNLMGFGTQ